MKVRNGFVSNSSTSSFICDICGESYTGWDAYPSDPNYECSVCPHEHIMCNEHLLDAELPMVNGCEHEFDRETNKCCSECGEDATIEREMVDEDGYIDSAFCPVCNFETYTECEMASYLERTRGITREEVFAKIKEMNKRRKKLYDAEYITHVCEKFDLTDKKLLDEIKEKFVSFDEYAEFLR